MHGDLLLVVFILVLGCAAFFFGVIYLACKFLAFVGRGLVGLFRHRPDGKGGGCCQSPRVRVCSQPACRNVEHRPARYCSRCGRRFAEVSEGGKA